MVTASTQRLFAIICWGNSGSQWLSKLLNSHPEVLCFHHVKGQWGDVTTSRRIDNLSYMELIARQGRPYQLSGDIHGIDIESVESLKQHFGCQLTLASLVRHPVLRVRSHLAGVQKRGLGYYRIRYRKLRSTLPAELRTLLSTKERLFFVHVMGLVNRVRAEAALGPVYTLESLSSDFSQVKRLLETISNKELEPIDGLNLDLWQRPLNSHTQEQQASPPDVFATFSEWQRVAFARLLHPESREIYNHLGLDLSFI